METIVVGIADTDSAEEAAREAAQLANACGATLHIVCAIKDPHGNRVGTPGENWSGSAVDRAAAHIQDLEGRLGTPVKTSTAVVTGDPGRALVAEAERVEADVIVVGNKGTHGVSRVLGSVASDVVRHAPCAVYIAKTT